VIVLIYFNHTCDVELEVLFIFLGRLILPRTPRVKVRMGGTYWGFSNISKLNKVNLWCTYNSQYWRLVKWRHRKNGEQSLPCYSGRQHEVCSNWYLQWCGRLWCDRIAGVSRHEWLLRDSGSTDGPEDCGDKPQQKASLSTTTGHRLLCMIKKSLRIARLHQV